jgi:hypothetical protein
MRSLKREASHWHTRGKPMTGRPGSPAGVSFERDVRPMFREKDRDSMLKAFDLWSYGDVQAHQEQPQPEVPSAWQVTGIAPPGRGTKSD